MSKPAQLVDIIPVRFISIGENAEELRRLRLENKLSLRQLAKETGHSISYLQQQLRKFGIDHAKGNLGIAPYGWDWTGHRLIKNAKEQKVIREALKLRKGGLGYEAIASDLNGQGIAAKHGGKWWPVTIRKVICRASEISQEERAQ